MKVWELLRDTFLDMGVLRYGTETAGSSDTVLTDSTFTLTADNLINGTAFVLSAGGEAPEGEFQRISDNTTNTLTLATALTAQIAVGDTWGYIQREFKTASLIPSVNMALRKIGLIGIQDTSITTADNQTEYTLPVAIKKGRIRGIYYQADTTDANDNRWFPIEEWRVIPATAGSTATLVLPQYPSGHSILIEYIGLHPDVTTYSSEIHESIAPELAKASLKVIFANYRAEGAISSQDGFNQQWNKAQDEFDEARRRWKVWLPDRKPRRLRVYKPRIIELIESEYNKVIL